MLMLVGGVDAIAGGHLGSWMILLLFVFLFARRRKGCESSWGLNNTFQKGAILKN
jgi:hypothetical protein